MKRRLYQLVAIVMTVMITQTSVLPQTPPEPPDQFQKVKMLVLEGKKSKAINVTLLFESDRLVIRPRTGGYDGKEFSYTENTSAKYSYSKHARWKETLGVTVIVGVATGGIAAVATGIGVFVLKEKRHRLTIEIKDDKAVLLLDKKNHEDIRTKMDAKGIKVETVEETK